MEILFIIIGFLIGTIGVYFYLKPKLIVVKQVNADIEKKNKALKETKNQLTKDVSNLLAKNSALIATKEEIINNISELKNQSEKTTEILYEQQLKLLGEKMDNAATEMSKNYEEASEKAKNSYLENLAEYAKSFQNEIAEKEKSLKETENKLKDLSQKVEAAVKANKRNEEMKDKENFYKLQISSKDLEEIKRLKDVSSYLRNDEPLNKVIWKVYYEKAYTDLIGRVIGPGVHTGIYKITNIQNKKCYVGQAVDLSSRWKQHIKRGIGADTPTKNKLYPAMLKDGVENFTFEVIEECDRSKLNEREDYWQEYFKAKEFGYSIK